MGDRSSGGWRCPAQTGVVAFFDGHEQCSTVTKSDNPAGIEWEARAFIRMGEGPRLLRLLI